MKRLLGLLLAVMVMMGGISCAVAENANPLVSDWLTELKSKRLIQIVEDEIGEGWTLYQPNGREEEENFSSAENLKEMRFLPVVAQKGNQLRLLILRRQGDLWKVSEHNNRALMRDGWTQRRAGGRSCGLWSSSGIIPIPAPRISVGSCRN